MQIKEFAVVVKKAFGQEYMYRFACYETGKF